jgi:hypothetical protein
MEHDKSSNPYPCCSFAADIRSRCAQVAHQDAAEEMRNYQLATNEAALANGVDKFKGFIDKRFRPPAGFDSPFGEMGACVLDKAQDFLAAVTVMGRCFSFSEMAQVAAPYTTVCPRDIADQLLANLHTCCLGFETVPSARRQEAMCKKLLGPSCAAVGGFVSQFQNCTRDPSRCHPFRQEYRRCDRRITNEFLSSTASREDCIDALRVADRQLAADQAAASAGSTAAVAAAGEPVLQNVLPRLRKLIKVAGVARCNAPCSTPCNTPCKAPCNAPCSTQPVTHPATHALTNHHGVYPPCAPVPSQPPPHQVARLLFLLDTSGQPPTAAARALLHKVTDC